MPRTKRPLPALPAYLSPALLAIGIALLGVWGLHTLLKARALGLSDATVAAYHIKHVTDAYPVHIAVGNKISLRVVEAARVNGRLPVSPDTASHVLGSALPGDTGNIIIYGHNLNSVFGFLADARAGDPVVVTTKDSRQHRYTIVSTATVDPSQTQLLANTPREVLTLYTCTGFLDSQRFVARAVPVL